MYEASGSRMLCNTLLQYHQYIQKVRRLTIENHRRSMMSSEEHKEILAALRNKDGERAEQLATQHILNSMKNLQQYDIEELLHEKQSDGKEEDYAENYNDTPRRDGRR